MRLDERIVLERGTKGAVAVAERVAGDDFEFSYRARWPVAESNGRKRHQSTLGDEADTDRDNEIETPSLHGPESIRRMLAPIAVTTPPAGPSHQVSSEELMRQAHITDAPRASRRRRRRAAGLCPSSSSRDAARRR